MGWNNMANILKKSTVVTIKKSTTTSNVKKSIETITVDIKKGA